MKTTQTAAPTGVIACPVCGKEKLFLYNAQGMMTSRCGKCGRTILWDLTNQTATVTNNRSVS